MSKFSMRRKSYGDSIDRWWQHNCNIRDLIPWLNDFWRWILDGQQNGENSGLLDGLKGFVKELIDGSCSFPGLSYENWFPASSIGPLVPGFVGICMDKMTLRKVLQEACKHEEALERSCKIGIDGRPSITIIADKWDPKVFDEFENDLVFYAENDGCIVNIILVTDYGVSTIVSMI